MRGKPGPPLTGHPGRGAGYEQRPEGFPQSVVLCGVRDIRDYRIRSCAGEIIAGGSPFNVAAKSLHLGDFREAETRAAAKVALPLKHIG